MKISRLNASVAISCLLVAQGLALIGDSEEELAHRYGEVTSRQTAIKSFQGRTYTYGEYLRFHSDDWSINALMINKRCEEVSYHKLGDWTETQIRHILEVNGGRSQWEEQKTTMPKLHREWKRRDRTTALWRGGIGLQLQTPVVEQICDAIEKKAKEEASKLPGF